MSFRRPELTSPEPLQNLPEKVPPNLCAGDLRENRSQVRPGGNDSQENFCAQPPPRRTPAAGLHRRRRDSDEQQQPAVRGTVFSPRLAVFALEWYSGPRASLNLLETLPLVQRWREALLSYCEDAAPRVRAMISGHGPSGQRLEEPHLALAPLAFVGHPNADGHIAGLAAAIPASLDPGARQQVVRILGQVRELRLGELGVWRLVQKLDGRPPSYLRAEAWTAYPAGATHWATVTPVAFDRHPRSRDRRDHQQEVSAMIADGCEAIGLPQPREVVVTPVSAHPGVPPAYSFPRLTRKDGTERRHAHAILVFDQPVRGPVLIGAGRYRGYGLCRPINAEVWL